MMKKISMLMICVFAISFTFSAYASDIRVYGEEDILNSDELGEIGDYVAEEIVEKNAENGFDDVENVSFNSVFGFVFVTITQVFSGFASKIGAIFTLIVLSCVSSKLVDGKNAQTIVSYITTLCLLKCILDVFVEVFAMTTASLRGLSDILTLAIPSFASILLLGGNNFGSVSSTLSLSATLIFIETLLTKLLVPCVSALLCIFVFERISTNFAEMNLFKSVKKLFLSAVGFVTMVMITVISFQNILSASKDSLSARTAKFAAANFVPIVGGAVAESLRTVGSSLSYMKSTVGLTVAIAIFVTVLPSVVSLVILKVFFRFFAISASLMQCEDKNSLFDNSTGFLDIILGIIICVTVLSIIIITLFIKTTVAVSL